MTLTHSYYIINEGKGYEWHFEPAEVSDLKGEIEATEAMILNAKEARDFWVNRLEPWKYAVQLERLSRLEDELVDLEERLEKAVSDWKSNEALQH